jgi:4,5-DOPA dioxygenase extradiol
MPMPVDPLSPVLYLPHGGGPLPLLGDHSHLKLIDFLTSIGNKLGNPSALLIVSAHWEEQRPTVTSGTTPPLLYDYFGFPEAAYQITYPAPGQPALANKIHRVLQEAGLDSDQDEQRGFDHGVFVPLKLMYPDATIPCVQLSLVTRLEPALHIRIGSALGELRKENIIILGSGFSFHNQAALMQQNSTAPESRNEAFEDWLAETMTSNEITETERHKRLVEWELAPFARYCHPREEHLIPLHVCYGAAGSPAQRVFNDTVLNKRTSAYLWPS